jgi:hypothetical protein
MHGQSIALLDHFGAALGQLGAQCDDSFTFLNSQAAKVGETNPLFPALQTQPAPQISRQHDGCHDAVPKLTFTRNPFRQRNEARKLCINLPTRPWPVLNR